MAKCDRASAIEWMVERVDATLAQSGHGFPHYADPETGIWTRTPSGDWTGGFWVGQLWLAARATGKQRYVEAARAWSERLRPRLDSQSVFKGFLFYYAAALGDLLFQDGDARKLAAQGAEALAGMFNPDAGLIPLGKDAEEASSVGPNEANIDALPGTTRLLLAPGKGSAMWEIGRRHVRQHVALCMREDGSICQSATFDSATGRLVRRYTHKGVHDDSTWARAQAWGMLGLAQALQGGADEFEREACRAADWWILRTSGDPIAYWDFDDPAIPAAPRDTSATVIAAAALLKLAHRLPQREHQYIQHARRSIDLILERHVTPVSADDRRARGILVDGCFNRKLGVAPAHELVWGDYFLLESLLSLEGQVDPRRI